MQSYGAVKKGTWIRVRRESQPKISPDPELHGLRGSPGCTVRRSLSGRQSRGRSRGRKELAGAGRRKACGGGSGELPWRRRGLASAAAVGEAGGGGRLAGGGRRGRRSGRRATRRRWRRGAGEVGPGGSGGGPALGLRARRRWKAARPLGATRLDEGGGGHCPAGGGRVRRWRGSVFLGLDGERSEIRKRGGYL